MESIPKLLKNHKSTFLVVFVIWAIFSIIVLGLVYTDFKVMILPNFGILGDSFNIITSLFTGLAFAGVIVSVVLQTQELEESRKELAKQAKHLGKQQQEMVSQSFDNKFFQMLKMFNTNLEHFSAYDSRYDSSKKAGYVKGKATIGGILYRFNEKSILSFDKKFKNLIEGEDSATVKTYCISLYQILKYVDEKTPTKAPTKEAKRYSNILRAQLSPDELILLMYNAIGVIPLSGSGEEYKKLLEKYAFLEHLSVEYLDKQNKTYVDYVLKEYESKVAGKNQALKEKIEKLQKQD